MVAPTFDPYDYAIHEDPYPTYAALRDEAPLYRNEQRGFWALSRHADVGAAFRDFERFSNADGVSLDPAATGPQAASVDVVPGDGPAAARPDAAAGLARASPPGASLDLEPRVRAITDVHLAPALAKGDVRLHRRLAGKVPMDVVSELLGVPAADRAELRRLADVARAPRGRRLRRPAAAASRRRSISRSTTWS